MRRTAGLSIVEVLLAAAVLLLGVLGFTLVIQQSAASVARSYLSSAAATALQNVSQQIQNGHPDYTRTRTLTPTDLTQLATEGGVRQEQSAALSGTITALASDPPTYRVTLTSLDFTLSALVNAPGGAP
jgi:Tfp pilus assembly protein PilV